MFIEDLKKDDRTCIIATIVTEFAIVDKDGVCAVLPERYSRSQLCSESSSVVTNEVAIEHRHSATIPTAPLQRFLDCCCSYSLVYSRE